jgi:hypothetical protein
MNEYYRKLYDECDDIAYLILDFIDSVKRNSPYKVETIYLPPDEWRFIFQARVTVPYIEIDYVKGFCWLSGTRIELAPKNQHIAFAFNHRETK